VLAKLWGALRSKFVRDAATLQAASMISQVFQVFTTAALAMILGAKGQGLYVSAIALQALVFFLVNVGVLQATVSQVAAAASRDNEYKSSGWIAFLAKTVAVFGVIIFVIGWFVLPWIGELVYKDRSVGLWAWWLCAMPLIELPKVVASAAFQGTRRMVALGQLDNVYDFCRFFLVVCGALVRGDAVGAIVGLLVASGVGAVVAVGLYHKARRDGGYPLPSAGTILKRGRDIKIRQGIRQGIRVALIKNGQSLFGNIFPRLIIGAVTGLDWVAYFHIAQRFLGVPMMIGGGISRTLLPALGEFAGQKDLASFRRLYFRSTFITGILVTSALLATLAMTPWLTRTFFPADYVEPVYAYAKILLLGLVPFAFAVANEPFYIVANKLKALLWLTLLGAVITIPTNVWLITHIPYTGTAWGLALYQSWVLVHLGYISFFFLRTRSSSAVWSPEKNLEKIAEKTP
jgi:O-antigen/teichoic acid export membrane protein